MSNTKVGRKPAVDSDIFFNLLSKYTVLNEKGELISSTCSVWHVISQELGGKLNPKSVYIKVLKDSNEVLTRLRKINGFDIIDNKNPSSTESNDSNDESSLISHQDFDKKIFNLQIPYDMYRQFYPKKVYYQRNNKKREYEVLKQGTWTDIINDEFLKVHKLPCNFIYKRAKVYNPTNSQHFLKFEAKCKDKVCGAKMIGWSDHKPSEGEPLKLKISTVDTRGLERKHTTKRPLKGEKRFKVGLELDKDLACNWRRHNVSDLEYGRISPPNLYQLETLRKVKQEGKDKRLGITYNCPIQSLIEFKHNSSYSGSIHAIGIDPFYVHYWTNHQISIYKDICKGYCKLSLDASGGFMKKLKRTSLGLLSASIFLYEGIVSTPFGHISVTQMVSEKHDTLTIFQWLAVWMSSGLRPPNEVVCDYSRALLAAISRSFCNGIGLNDYVNYVFKVLIGIEKKIPATYIRLDVAHMVKIFCRIKCLTGVKNKYLKEFYVRGFRLLMTSEDIKTFEKILEAVLTVMLSETDGWSNNIETPSETARLYILELIKGIRNDELDNETISDPEFLSDFEDFIDKDENEDSHIEIFLENIKQKSIKNSSVVGNRISAYFLKDLLPDTMRLCKHFPLWTNVLSNLFQSPYRMASSAPVENDFKELKTQILKFDVRPMRADKFILKHLTSIDSNVKHFKSKELRYESSPEPKSPNLDFQCDELFENENMYSNDDHKCINIKTEHDDEMSSDVSGKSITACENWKGKGIVKELFPKKKSLKMKPRHTKYMGPKKDIDRILSTVKTRSTLNSLLINGNLATPVIVSKKRYLVQNTCPFDALSVLVATAYIDVFSYQNFADKSTNCFLNFCKTLAIKGTSRSIYKQRVLMLTKIFDVDSGVTDILLINARCNVNYIISKYFIDEPSAYEKKVCSTCGMKKIFKNATIIMKIPDGFKTIEEGLNNYVNCIYSNCSNCTDGVMETSRELNSHLFIETDTYSEFTSYALNEYPEEVNVNKNRFVLVGGIGYKNDHYIAYVKRASGWETHNDLVAKIKLNSSTIKIHPHVLMYVKM